MFLIHLQNGELWQEGDGGSPPDGVRFVRSWADVPNEVVIAGVTLTDGIHIYETMRGYDHYLVCQEGVLTVHTSAAAAGKITPTSQSMPSTIAQSLYGIRELRQLKQMVREAETTVRDSIRQAFEPQLNVVGKNLYHLKAYQSQEAEVTTNINKLLLSLESKEVEHIRIGVQRRFIKRLEFKESESGLRQGAPHLNGFNPESVRQAIYKVEETKNG